MNKVEYSTPSKGRGLPAKSVKHPSIFARNNLNIHVKPKITSSRIGIIMFDKLDMVRETWSEGKPVIILDAANRAFFSLPAQAVFGETITKMRELGASSLYLVLNHVIFRDLEIPLMSSLYQGVSSRYPLVQLMADDGGQLIQLQSISIASRLNNMYETDTSKAESLRKFGDAVDDKINGSRDKSKLKADFSSIFTTPGEITIVKGEYQLLRVENRINELSLGLCEITSYPPCLLIAPIISETGAYLTLDPDDDSWNDISVVPYNLIINLWRSIKKVSKEKIEYLK